MAGEARQMAIYIFVAGQSVRLLAALFALAFAESRQEPHHHATI